MLVFPISHIPIQLLCICEIYFKGIVMPPFLRMIQTSRVPGQTTPALNRLDAWPVVLMLADQLILTTSSLGLEQYTCRDIFASHNQVAASHSQNNWWKTLWFTGKIHQGQIWPWGKVGNLVMGAHTDTALLCCLDMKSIELCSYSNSLYSEITYTHTKYSVY